MSEVRRDGYNYHNTYVESVEWQRDKAYARAEKAEREISDAWLMIENGWADNIESRAEWEKRYRENFNSGGSGPLGMAIHAAGYKRETKAEARAEKLAAALREAGECLSKWDTEVTKARQIIARALAGGEEGR